MADEILEELVVRAAKRCGVGWLVAHSTALAWTLRWILNADVGANEAIAIRPMCQSPRMAPLSDLRLHRANHADDLDRDQAARNARGAESLQERASAVFVLGSDHDPVVGDIDARAPELRYW